MAGNPLHNTEASPFTYSPFIYSMAGGKSGKRKGPLALFKGAGHLTCTAYLRMNMAKTTIAGAGTLVSNEYQRQKWSGAATFAGSGNLTVSERQINQWQGSAALIGSGTLAVNATLTNPGLSGGSFYQLLFAA